MELDSTTKQPLKKYWENLKQEFHPVNVTKLFMKSDRFYQDYYYLPSLHQDVFKELGYVFAKHSMFAEFAVGRLGAAIGWKEFYLARNNADLKAMYLWNYRVQKNGHPYREDWPMYYNSKLDFLHPIKLSEMENVNSRSCYCRTYVKALLQARLDKS